MKIPSSCVGVVAVSLLTGFAPAFGAPKPEPKASAKAVADPLEIPAFAPIPNEFVFAGTQKDVYKLLERYTGGISLDKIPEPNPKERKALKDKATLEDNNTLQALLDVKHLLAPIHVVRVRSVSYFGLEQAAQDKAFEDLGRKTAKAEEDGGISLHNRGYDRSSELLAEAETFYKNLLAKQGGHVQMQLRGETSITVYAFSQPRTFAVVTRGPSRVIVARADGKPDVGAITGIFQRVVAGG